MTPYTAHLLYRVHVRTAATYVKFVKETNPIVHKIWESNYKTGDIKKWAKDRIESLLKRANALQSLFANDDELCSSAQSATRDSFEALAQIGYPSGSVGIPDAGTLRTDDDEVQVAPQVDALGKAEYRARLRHYLDITAGSKSPGVKKQRVRWTEELQNAQEITW